MVTAAVAETVWDHQAHLSNSKQERTAPAHESPDETMRPIASLRLLATAIAAVSLLCGEPASVFAAPIRVPIAYDHHLLLVDVRLGKSGPYTFLVDTDTTPSAIDLRLAHALKLRFQGSAGIAAGVGAQANIVIPTTIPQIRVGSMVASNVAALAMNLSSIGKRLNRRIDGVLGTSFLHGRVVQIDYSCRRLVFGDIPANPMTTVRFRRGDENIASDVWIGGHRMTATFDTGDAGYLVVTSKGAEALPVLSSGGRTGTVVGYNGAAKVTHSTISGLRIGSIAFQPTEAVVLKSDDSPYDLNVGNRLLERFIVTFDYKRDLVVLSPKRPC